MEARQILALELKLESGKTSYRVREPIEVRIILRNQSDRPVTINSRMGVNPGHLPDGYWELMFDITFPPGGRRYAGPPVHTGLPERKHFAVLPPNGEIGLDYVLTKWHWMQFPGPYEVRAVYRNIVDGKEYGVSAWTGEIKSNPIHLDVVE